MSLFSYSRDPAQLMLMIGIRLLIIFTILPVHEYAHAWAARKMGDNTALISGRLTMNPLAHVDFVGALCLLIFGFGWAKPVPVNPRNFKNYKKGIAFTAAAGPMSNLICAFIGMLAFNIVACIPVNSESTAAALFYTALGLRYFSMINVSLAVFNLIPVTPLDGSRILSTIVSGKVNFFMQKYQREIYIGFLILIMTNALSRPMSWLIDIVMRGISLLLFWVEPLMNLIF